MLVLQGWGAPPQILSQGYGAPNKPAPLYALVLVTQRVTDDGVGTTGGAG